MSSSAQVAVATSPSRLISGWCTRWLEWKASRPMFRLMNPTISSRPV